MFFFIYIDTEIVMAKETTEVFSNYQGPCVILLRQQTGGSLKLGP